MSKTSNSNSFYSEPHFLLTSGPIKLRDLPNNLWNADRLFVLTETIDKARQLARVAEDEEWYGETYVYENREEINRALGIGRMGLGLLSVWWD